MNWLRQSLAVGIIGLAGVRQRPATAFVVVFGMASVVGVLTAMLSLTAGMTRAYVAPEDPGRALVWAGSANFDTSRSLHRDVAHTILDAPGIAKDATGQALADPEFVMRLPPVEGFVEGSLQLRGVGPVGLELRPELRVVSGHMFRAGRRELVAGVGAAKKFGLKPGSTVQLVDGSWPIVGTFAYRGEVIESTLIGDADTIMAATRRRGFAQVLTQLQDASAFAGFKQWLTTNPTLQVSVEKKLDYDQRMLGPNTTLFTQMAYGIGVIMAIGALFGVVKIMYAAVRMRTREIGTLRALGFNETAIASSVIVEAVLLGLLGAVLGTAIAWLIFDGREMWVWGAFRLHVSLGLLALGMQWALLTSLLGGIFPAIRAARIPASEALGEA
jgi:putative ABC transport system permease protein